MMADLVRKREPPARGRFQIGVVDRDHWRRISESEIQPINLAHELALTDLNPKPVSHTVKVSGRFEFESLPGLVREKLRLILKV